MTKEVIKVYFPYLKALAEDKEVQCDISGEWKDIEEILFSMGVEHYRIKPKLKYRPFKNKEECWNEMMKHQPFGWVIGKINKNFYNIDFIYSCNPDNGYGVRLSYYGEASTKYENMFKGFTFADGTPFGIKEE